jgi:ABC-type sugar transport system substrate-binding protein
VCALLTGCDRPATPPALRVAMVVKVKGDAYFAACARGGQEAAKELGVQFFYEPPMDASVEEQIDAVDSMVARRMDAIVIAPHEALALAPALKRARENGVHVITFDTDADPKRSGREWFVKPASDEAVVRGLVGSLVSSAGPKAQIAIFASASAATRQQLWIRKMLEYIGKTCPLMQIADIQRCEDAKAAYTATQQVLSKNPEVTGIVALTPDLLVSAAEAVKSGGQRRFVTGVGLPNGARPLVKAGIVPAFVAWNPTDLGYLAVQVAVQTIKGSLREDAGEISFNETEVVDGLPRLTIVKKPIKDREILLGEPMIVTAEKVDQFNF